MTTTARPTTDPASLSGTVAVVDNPMPGGHLAWTVTRRLAGGAAPLRLLDQLGDGQRFDTGFTPILTATRNGNVTYSAPLAAATVSQNPGGGSQVVFNLSGLPLGGADTVSLSFRSVIAPQMTATNALVGQGDTLQNSAILLGQPDQADIASVTLPSGGLNALIYAVNGVLSSQASTAAAGDQVTYRLRLHLPLSTARQVQVVALPPGGIAGLVFDGAGTGTTPAPGHAQWGPAATYLAAVPSISAGPSGAVTFNFGTLAPVYGPGATDIDLLFTTLLTTTGTTAPTLQATETEANAAGTQSSSATTIPVSLSMPQLTIQTASLYASGVDSFFAGTGGPFGFDPVMGQFGGVVSSAGLDGEAFRDQVWNVQAGDVVTFVIAVQNRATQGGAYDVTVRDTMPAGFAAPADGVGLGVTDGAGNLLNTTGDLFDPNGGLVLTDPLGAYDPNTGANVPLLTFTLQATIAIAAPTATLQNVAQILSYAGLPTAASSNGALPQTIQASTAVTTPGIDTQAVPNQTIVSLRAGQQASFDVTVTLPEGEVRDLRIDEILPQTGAAWLVLDSVSLIQLGANLVAHNQGIVQPNGSIDFGTVTNTPDAMITTADKIVVRVTVHGCGTAGGQGTLQTIVSAVDPNVTGGRWSSTLTNQLMLDKPNAPPSIAGTTGGQNATDTMSIVPFSSLVLADPDAGQLETLTIHRSDPYLGTLSGAGLTTTASGDYVLRGTVGTVRAEAQNLVFATGPGRSGNEQFTLTVDDGAGGVVTDSATTVNIAAASPDGASIQHFPLSATGTVQTSTATGSTTIAQVETYQGPVSYLQSQFIYDGTQPLVIVAQTPNVFIKNVAGTAAVQLLSGQNVVDAGHGSNFILGGTGQDVFYLDGRQVNETWDTIVGCNPGDIATL
ncbi:MAG: hypothetical protein NVSMB18_04340 [Acetobacteraceae bacterium]